MKTKNYYIICQLLNCSWKKWRTRLNKILVVIGLVMLILGSVLWFIGITGKQRSEDFDILDSEERNEYRTYHLMRTIGVLIGIFGLFALAVGAALGYDKEKQQKYLQYQYRQLQPYQQPPYPPQPYPQQTQELGNSRSCQNCGMQISIHDGQCPYCGHINS